MAVELRWHSLALAVFGEHKSGARNGGDVLRYDDMIAMKYIEQKMVHLISCFDFCIPENCGLIWPLSCFGHCRTSAVLWHIEQLLTTSLRRHPHADTVTSIASHLVESPNVLEAEILKQCTSWLCQIVHDLNGFASVRATGVGEDQAASVVRFASAACDGFHEPSGHEICTPKK